MCYRNSKGPADSTSETRIIVESQNQELNQSQRISEHQIYYWPDSEPRDPNCTLIAASRIRVSDFDEETNHDLYRSIEANDATTCTLLHLASKRGGVYKAVERTSCVVLFVFSPHSSRFKSNPVPCSIALDITT